MAVDPVALQSELDDLLAAKHAILTGKQKVSSAAGDKRVEYRAALFSDMEVIDRRITEIRILLGQTRRRSIRVGF